MNLQRLKEIISNIPEEATEILIKGRDSEEVFFTMPKGWKPSPFQDALVKMKIVFAPNPTYYSRQGGSRWRIGIGH